MISRALLSATAALALAGSARAAGVLTYSGYLRDAQGKPVSTATTIAFRFYPAPEGGSPVWEDPVTVLPNADGWFSAVLGAAGANPLDPADFAQPLWLALQVATDAAEMAPRTRIGSSPYALTVDWSGVSGRPNTFPSSWAEVAGKPDYFPADPAVTQRRILAPCPDGRYMAGVAVDGSPTCVPAVAAVTSAPPLAVAVTGATSAVSLQGCPSAGQILKWNGTAWACADDANSGGDITAVSAGSGLAGGGTSGAVTLSADYTAVQRRLQAGCDEVSYLTGVDQAGNPACAAETPEWPLRRTGRTTSIAPSSITSAHLALLAASHQASHEVTLGPVGSTAHYYVAPQPMWLTREATCLVIATLALRNTASWVGGASNVSNGPEFRIAVFTTGVDSDDGDRGQFPGPLGADDTTSMTRAKVIVAPAIAFTDFGCRVANVPLDWVGDTADCQVTWLCF